MAWRKVLDITDGHRYFADDRNRVAVADQSGMYPENTDDGVLYVATSEPVLFTLHDCRIPLYNPEGNRVYTCGSAYEGLRVARAFNMAMEATP